MRAPKSQPKEAKKNEGSGIFLGDFVREAVKVG